jgi:hypothetical protein
MTRSAIFEPGSDLSKVRFEIGDQNRFPNLQETEPTETQQALNGLSEGLRARDNPSNEVDPNRITLRFEQYKISLLMVETLQKAVETAHNTIRDCLPKIV